ncbi:MAG: sn-glycerol-3-phosphate ABC transporter ATP-binding protein UgpC [Gammaproteobacteria bacterium]|jgi:multiple sugar transport system ATP-binding protein
MAEIVLDKISKRFADGTLALQETSLTIADGEFFVLVGPSGCGKSTLLNLIVGLEEISAGQIRVDGQAIDHIDPKDRNMAMVFQSYAIYPHMSVRDNLAFPLKMAKLPKQEIARRVHRAAQMLGLIEHLARKPASLSGGQRQRVAMGRAIVRDPKAFLMDEPLSNLDAKLRGQMRSEIARLQKQLGTTTVYVTHDQTEAMTLGDRVAVLRDGKIHQIGTPRELYRKPRNLFVAGFIGSPSMNFLPARYEGGRIILPIAEIRCQAQAQERFTADGIRQLIAGIRPEHIQDPANTSRDVDTGVSFQAAIDAVEWIGSDLYAYFNVRSESDVWRAMPHDVGSMATEGGTIGCVARLDPASRVAQGSLYTLWLNIQDMHFFDAQTGENLMSPSILASG